MSGRGSFRDTIEAAKSQDGRSLYELSYESALLLLFLRFFGCSHCRSRVAELARYRRPLEQNGVKIAFVYVGEEAEAEEFFGSFGVQDYYRFRDPERNLYESFELRRGSVFQTFNPRAMFRYFLAYRKFGGASPKENDSLYQMPGAFLIHQGKIENAYRPADISGTPNYLELARCEFCDEPEPAR